MLFSKSLNALPGAILLNSFVICRVISTKFRITIDENLNWGEHVTNLSKTISRNTGIILKLRSSFPEHILKTIYSSLVLPYLNYGNLAWGNCDKKHLNKIHLIQKRAVRAICGVGWRDHTAELFVKLKLFNIHDLYYFNVGNFMFFIESAAVPLSLASKFIKNKHIHNYSTRQSKLYHQQLPRTTSRSATIFVFGPKYWNSLPESLRNCSTFSTFKLYHISHIHSQS